MASPLQGQQSTGCRKTCGKGGQADTDSCNGLFDTWLALAQGSPGCRFNGRFLTALWKEQDGKKRARERLAGALRKSHPAARCGDSIRGYREPLRCLLVAPPGRTEQADEGGGGEEPSETGRRWVVPLPVALGL